MLFKSSFINEEILKIKRYILGMDRAIKNIEFYRGLYRYPNKMIGRKINIKNLENSKIDTLVIAAHPDDDILGLGTTLYRDRLNGKNVVVVFVTNGTNWESESWRIKEVEAERRAVIRYNEAVQALSLIGIPNENVLCLGFPDAGTHRYLKQLAIDIQMLIHKLNPGTVYAHCIEGGHSDHDMTSYVVRSICKKISYTNIFEWTEYNPQQPLGTQKVQFLPSVLSESKEEFIEISKEERELKKKMLAYHESQDVEKYYKQGELIRKANFSRLEAELDNYCKLSRKRLVPVVKGFSNSINSFNLDK